MSAMTQLGNGLFHADHHEDAASLYEARLSLMRRLSASEVDMLVAQSNLAISYANLGRYEEALSARRDVYSGYLKLFGEAHKFTLMAAFNYSVSLRDLQRYAEAKLLLRKTMPMARRVLGENNEATIRMWWNYALAIYDDTGATLDDFREAVNTLEETVPTTRRLLGGAHPLVRVVEEDLQKARAALRARGGDDVSALRDSMAAMTPGDA